MYLQGTYGTNGKKQCLEKVGIVSFMFATFDLVGYAATTSFMNAFVANVFTPTLLYTIMMLRYNVMVAKSRNQVYRMSLV